MGGRECVQYTSQSFQMPIDHNGPGATQCHVDGFGLCDPAQHNQDTSLDRQSSTYQMRRKTITGRCQVAGDKIKFCLSLGDLGATMLQLQPRGREYLMHYYKNAVRQFHVE